MPHPCVGTAGTITASHILQRYPCTNAHVEFPPLRSTFHCCDVLPSQARGTTIGIVVLYQAHGYAVVLRLAVLSMNARQNPKSGYSSIRYRSTAVWREDQGVAVEICLQKHVPLGDSAEKARCHTRGKDVVTATLLSF